MTAFPVRPFALKEKPLLMALPLVKVTEIGTHCDANISQRALSHVSGYSKRAAMPASFMTRKYAYVVLRKAQNTCCLFWLSMKND